jgi:AraC-like DNA-binding protein/quercetin dioxygenase-like cupin family protein
MNPSSPSRPAAPAVPEFFSTHVSTARRFYLSLKPAPGQALAVVCGGREQCTPDYAVRRSDFPYYSVEFVARGLGTLCLQGKNHPLQPGFVFSYGPGVSHHIVANPADPPLKYFVDFHGEGALSRLRSAGLAPGRVMQTMPPNELQALFDELIRSGLKGTRFSPPICLRLLECLLLKVEESKVPSGGIELHSFQTYQHCRAHLERHFGRLRSIQELARECHVNAAYLCRLFHRYDHLSPYQYLLRLKMHYAAELLEQPGALAKQVAEQAGFGDPFHFSRVFKRVFGVSPQAFQRLR